MEPPRTRQELDVLFVDCAKTMIHSGTDERIREKLEALSTGVAIQGIFSDNEEFEDVETSDLGYIMTDFWLAYANMRGVEQPGIPDPSKRLARLQHSLALYDRFLLRCMRLKLHKEADDDDGAKMKKAEVTREEKIARFKRKKAAEEALKNAGDLRDKWEARIEIAIMDTLDEQDAIEREKQILEYMIKEQPTRGPPAVAPPPKPIDVTRVGVGLEIKKETFQDGVFKPYHRLPTMTIEQYGELEMKRMEEQKKWELENPSKPVLSLNELAEQGLEDDDKQHEIAQAKARKWDDWKDDVPKGSGITKRF